jgi:copper(I)-binding protein
MVMIASSQRSARCCRAFPFFSNFQLVKDMTMQLSCSLSRRALIGAALVLSLGVAGASHAEDVKAGDLVISQAWARATPGGAKVGGGYLTIENKGAAPDKLIGGSTDAAAKLEVHQMSMANGVMKMHPVEGGLVIEPGKTVKLAPGGYHLMMTDLKHPFKQGDKVPVTLDFEKAGKVNVSLDVQGIGAQAPHAASGQMEMKMDHMKMDNHGGKM